MKTYTKTENIIDYTAMGLLAISSNIDSVKYSVCFYMYDDCVVFVYRRIYGDQCK